MEVIGIDGAGDQPVSENSESVEIEGIEDEDGNIQETESAKTGVAAPVRLQDQSGGERDEFDEKENVGDRNIGDRTAKHNFVGGPENQADQPHKTAKGNEQPETADVRMTALEVLEGKKRGSADQAHLEAITKAGENIALRKKKGGDERNGDDANAKEQACADGARKVSAGIGRSKRKVVPSVHNHRKSIR
jgi:hypothetical protein